MKWRAKGLIIQNNVLLIPFNGGIIDEKAEYNIELKKHKPKRSISANAYAWKLIDELATVLKIGREQVYLQAIKECGVYDDINVADECSARFCEVWSVKGIGWKTEIIGRACGYTTIRAFYGSSSYNAGEMNKLIDWLVQECKMQGIPTKEEIEINELIKAMES